MKTEEHMAAVIKAEKEKAAYYKELFIKERNIKNGLYYFILKNGLFEKLKVYEPATDYQTTNHHEKCLRWFAENMKK